MLAIFVTFFLPSSTQIICSLHPHDWRSCLMQIETLSAMVDAVARSCGAKTVVDVGSGQVSHLLFCAWKKLCTCNQIPFEQNNLTYVMNT
jgi:uncharacterized SAM-dependent methyltransferase